MNIVKGVADLIRRSSTAHTPESGIGSSSGRFLLPSTKIRFSEIGDEAILCTLWERYSNAFDKVEKKKFFHMFLKQFIIVYKNWKPLDLGQSPEAALAPFSEVEYSQHDDLVFGCSAGHPAEITLSLIEELTHIAAVVSEFTSMNTSRVMSVAESLGNSLSLTFGPEGLLILEAMAIITRSMHNCKVFGFYGGIQKLTALMKGVYFIN